MSVDPSADAHQPAWWGAPVEQLGLARATTIMLQLTGIVHCEDFCDWSRAELGSWAAERGINPAPILLVLAQAGIQLAPNDRPDRLVRLLLAPASHANRQAAIEYYGLLGHHLRTLQEWGAEDPTRHQLLAPRLAAARPRLATLKRVAPQLALTLMKAGVHGEREPMQLAVSIAPLLGEGQTPPVNFARLLLDVLNPRLAAPVGPSKSRSALKQRPNWAALLSQLQGVPSPTGQRAERKRAATDLIDLLFNEDDA